MRLLGRLRIALSKRCRDRVTCVVFVWHCPLAWSLPSLYLVSVVLALPSLHPSTLFLILVCFPRTIVQLKRKLHTWLIGCTILSLCVCMHAHTLALTCDLWCEGWVFKRIFVKCSIDVGHCYYIMGK